MNPDDTEISPLTEARFTNAVERKVYLLVEGNSDKKFWLSRIEGKSCEISVMNSREKALEEMRKAAAEGNQTLIAILDADFDRFEGTLQEIEGVFWTDQPDLEGMCIASRALDKVLAEYCAEDKRMPGGLVRRHLLEQASHIGRLRLVSRRPEWGLTFRKKKGDGFNYIDYGALCPKESWIVDVRAMIQKVLDFSQRHDLRPEIDSLELQCKEIGIEKDADLEQLCNGHDLVGILVVGFKKKLGSRPMSHEQLEEALRLAFELSDLQQTRLAQALYAWESVHLGFRVLRAA